ncbi:AAA family ATPase [Sediminitomix flava]|uniref:Putative kinase n=1 Tax=Sediminitomix flava TaxID=379075 RepID=A0A315ZC75_SEDFL|nr:AAA family ATPase [Sediminitomix flava]PWJ43176.1 putative kinase [Sediminitomix flava]
MNWKFPYYEIDQPIDWDSLEAQFDWFQEMKDVPQDAIWHGEGDVMTHTKMVVDALVTLDEFKVLEEQDKHILFAAALMHDIEKRSTTSTEEIDGIQRIISPRHAKKGEFTVRKLLYITIPTPFKVREQICKLVRLHGLPLWAIEKSNPHKAVTEASLEVNTQHLAMLAKADVLGRICHDQEGMLERIEYFIELCIENECWGKTRHFENDFARFFYLNKEVSPDYIPFDNFEFEVFMMSALPGSGKDTYIAQNFDLPILSLDDIRRELKIDPKDKKKGGKVIQEAKELAKKYLREKQSFVFNATNITADMRRKWSSLFMTYGAKVSIIYIEVPYKQLLKQNHDREHKVPEVEIDKMIGKLEIPTAIEAPHIILNVD